METNDTDKKGENKTRNRIVPDSKGDSGKRTDSSAVDGIAIILPWDHLTGEDRENAIREEYEDLITPSLEHEELQRLQDDLNDEPQTSSRREK